MSPFPPPITGRRLPRLRFGRVSPALAWFVASVALLLALVALLMQTRQQANLTGRSTDPLVLHCATGMRLPIEEIIADYRAEYGVVVHAQYAGSNSLLASLQVHPTGDLYLPADKSYLQLARKKGLAQEILPLAHMQAVVGVPKGNPRSIASLDDLLQPGVRIVMANPDQAAIGKVTRSALQAAGRWKAIDQSIHQRGVYKPTVGDVASDIQIGSVDAGLLWDAVALQYSEIEIVRLPELSGTTVDISVGVLTSSKNPTAALHFARYLAARNRGLARFKSKGYQPVAGDGWVDRPELRLFAGAINRRALEPIIAAFEEREGVEVTTFYNGCGILTAQMRAVDSPNSSSMPDAFMACDSYYMDKVSDLFPKPITISSTPLVIVVATGNPKKIQSLGDLNRPGVKVALGQPKQCTVGVLSRRLLEAEGIYESVLENNVVTETATSALLVSSITTGAADAALVYATDAQAEGSRLMVIPIDLPQAVAIQPFGIAQASKQQQLCQRLLEAITQSKQHFESLGFNWELEDQP